MLLFKRHKQTDYSTTISILEKGEPPEIQQLLWQPKSRQVDYLSVTTEMLQKLKKPNSANNCLGIHQILDKGNFELVIFKLPWNSTSLTFTPLIFDKRSKKIVGIMLPFNELDQHLSRQDRKAINYLGAEWIKFTIPYNFK